jgi:putative tryptophan/tyrosine transport system substrate-binding protein
VRRREFIAGLGAVAWPLTARAQQGAVPVVGILGSGRATGAPEWTIAFLQGLKEVGFVEGQNVTFEYRWANVQHDRLPKLAADLVHQRVSLIAALGNYLSPQAAKGATASIPIVFAIGTDPVEVGLVASLNRPGGNVTGATSLSPQVFLKRMQLLHDLIPGARVFGYLQNPVYDRVVLDQIQTGLAAAQDAVRSWGSRVEILNVWTAADLDAAFATLAARQVEALTTGPDAFFLAERERLVALAAKYRIATIHFATELTRAGGLMSYTGSFVATYRQAGLYAGRILKGEKPADLPVVQATKFEFVINLRTAKSLGIEVAPGLLAIADEVIE